MRKLNKQINLDRANGAEENISTGEKPMRNASTKTPWYLRFASGAVLRQIGLAVLALTMLVGVQTPEANAQIRIDGFSMMTSYNGVPHVEAIRVEGLGPDSNIYDYPQWTVSSLRQDDDPNSDIDLPGLRAKIASINATFASDLSSALGSYMDSIDSATAAFVSSTNACLLRNESRTTLVNCPMTAWVVWMATMSTAISTLESSMASATKTANDAMAAWINYIN